MLEQVCSICLKPLSRSRILESALICEECERRKNITTVLKRQLNDLGLTAVSSLDSIFRIKYNGITRCPICNGLCTCNGHVSKQIVCYHCGVSFTQFSNGVSIKFIDTGEDTLQFKEHYFNQNAAKQRTKMEELKWIMYNI